MAANALKLSTIIVGENFEIYLCQIAANALHLVGFKLSTMVGENVEIYLSERAENALKLSTLVGEIF